MRDQESCDHMSTFSFGCLPSVIRCDKCGKLFGVEEALKKIELVKSLNKPRYSARNYPL
jgi:hypothetical protein